MQKIKRISAVVVIVLILVGIAYAVYAQSKRNSKLDKLRLASSEAQALKVAEAEEALSNEGLSPLQIVLRQHISAINAEGVNSYIISADYVVGGVKAELEMYAMNPGKCRQTVYAGPMKFIYGYDLERTWTESSMNEETEVAPENQYTLRMECNLYTLAWSYEAQGATGLERKQDLIKGGINYFVIENQVLLGEAGIPVLHYINSKTGLEEWREATFPIEGEPSTIILKYEYTSNTDSGRPRIQSYDLFVNDKLQVEANITSYRVNGGLTSLFFAMPTKNMSIPLPEEVASAPLAPALLRDPLNPKLFIRLDFQAFTYPSFSAPGMDAYDTFEPVFTAPQTFSGDSVAQGWF
ncbi:MAG: hypothetical protein ACSHYA_16380 [Opitutaceae bacterium]